MLNHFHGISIYIDLEPQGIAAVVPKFSVDIHWLRNKFCKEGEHYILAASGRLGLLLGHHRGGVVAAALGETRSAGSSPAEVEIGRAHV